MVFRQSQRGFTIIELMISLSIFSLIITLVSAGVIQIGRYYQRGNTKTRLISLTREIQANISQDYQFNGQDSVLTNTVPGYTGYEALCIGTTRYSYIVNTDQAFMIDRIDSPTVCSTEPVENPRKPLPKYSKITNLDFADSGAITGMKELLIRFVVGQNDMFVDNDYNKNCKSESGKEFCAVISLKSSIARKVAS